MTMDSQGAQRPGLMTFTQKSHRDTPNSFLGYNANGQRGLEGAHRATETSCVPLQESTAHRCVFFVYRRQAFHVSTSRRHPNTPWTLLALQTSKVSPVPRPLTERINSFPLVSLSLYRSRFPASPFLSDDRFQTPAPLF